MSLPFVLSCALAGFALSGSLWYAKNAVLIGNPVYPLAGNWFGENEHRTPEQIARWNRAHQVPRDAAGWRYSPSQFLAAKAQVAWRSEWLSPIAWPLAVLGLLATWRRRETRVLLAAVAWIFAVWWLATHRIDRFWLPAVRLLCLLGGAAWEASATRLYRRVLLGLVALGVLGATLMLLAPIVVEDRLVAIGNPFWLTPLKQLRQEQVSPSHRQLIASANANRPVLLVGDAEPFDLPMPSDYSTCFDPCTFELLTKDRSPEEIRAAFRDRAIAYVLVDWREIRRYRSPGNYGFTDYVQPKVFDWLIAQDVLYPARWSEESAGQVSWEIYPVRE